MHRSKIGIGLLAWLALASAAGAAVFYVKPGATGTGASWADAASFTSALAAAQPTDEIWVAAGTYTGVWSLYSKLYGGFAGTETEQSQRDPAANATILNGDGSAKPILTVGGSSDNFPDIKPSVVDGFTFQNSKGGALLGSASYLIIRNDVFRNNSVTGKGGAISSIGFLNQTYLQIDRCVFDSNSATTDGGAIYLQNGQSWVTNSLFANNSSTNHIIAGSIGPTSSNYGYTECRGNTVVHNTGSQAIMANVATNNIVAFNTGVGIRADEGGHNCVWQNAGGDFYGKDASFYPASIQQDPGFAADPTDFRLAPNSPCRNTGDNTTLAASTFYNLDFDLDGGARRQGPRVDMGCYESSQPVTTPPSIIHVKPGGSDLNDGATWDAAKATIQSAVDDLCGYGGEVWVAAGQYAPVQMTSGTGIYGGFAGTETQHGQRNPRANVSIIDAGGKAASCVNTPPSATLSTVVDGFTLRNSIGAYPNDLVETSHGSDYFVERHRGGGVFVQGGSPVIRNNVITGNYLHYVDVGPLATAESYGGAIYVSTGTPAIIGNTITANTACVGAGIACLGQATIADNLIVSNIIDPVFRDSTFSPRPEGYGIYWANAAAPTAGSITNNTLAENGMMLHYSPIVANNIVAFASYGIVGDASTAAASFHHNDVFGCTAADYTGMGAPAGNISANPLFADREQRDYRLAAGSPCIDAGDDAAVLAGSTDVTGAARIQGVHVDMGAYETAVASSFTFADAAEALRLAAGLAAADASSAARLNAARTPPSYGVVDLADAAAIARIALGAGVPAR
ncbi:MAG TPA: choice-of-anchor Q domain-containing protein [Armatimonadota bacterium]|jgi:predicted outer membrane repeat protein